MDPKFAPKWGSGGGPVELQKGLARALGASEGLGGSWGLSGGGPGRLWGLLETSWAACQRISGSGMDLSKPENVLQMDINIDKKSMQ